MTEPSDVLEPDAGSAPPATSQRKLLLEHTLFLSMGTYIEYFLGMVASVILARVLGPDGFGVYGLAIWFVVFARTLINSGVTLGAIRFLAESTETANRRLTAAIARLFTKVHLVKVSIVTALGALALALLEGRLFQAVPASALWLALAAIFFRTSYMYFISIAKGLQDFKSVAIVTTVGSVCNLALVGGGALLGFGVNGFLVVFLISSLVFFTASLLRVRHLLLQTEFDEIPEETRGKISYHLRVVTVTIIVGFFASKEIELLMLGALSDIADVGHFKVAQTLAAGLMLLVPGVFSGVLLPVMAKSVTQGHVAAGRRFVIATRYLLILAIPLLTFAALHAKGIIVAVYGAEYAPAGFVFALALVGHAFVNVANSAQSYLLSSDRQAVILKLTLAGLTLKIAVGIAAVKYFGLLGAILTYTGVAALIGTIKLAITFHALDVRFPLIGLARTALAAGISAAASWPVVALLGVSLLPLLLAGLVFSVSYSLLTLALGCWSRADLKFFGELGEKLPRRGAALAAFCLAWAARRPTLDY